MRFNEKVCSDVYLFVHSSSFSKKQTPFLQKHGNEMIELSEKRRDGMTLYEIEGKGMQ